MGPLLGVVDERADRDRGDPDASRQIAAELGAVVVAEWPGVGADEVSSLAAVDAEADVRQSGGDEVTLALQPGRRSPDPFHLRAQGDGDCRLERTAADKTHELLGGSGSCDQLGRTTDPPDLPSGDVEGLACR